MRVAVLLAILGLSFQVLMSNACARRHYAMTVREVVPSPAPRRTETFRGPADFRNSDHAEASNAGGQLGSAQSSQPLVATTGDEQQSPQSILGSSETNAKPGGLIGGQIQDSHAAAEGESQPPMDGWPLLNGRLLLLGGVIAVAVLCAVLARLRVAS